MSQVALLLPSRLNSAILWIMAAFQIRPLNKGDRDWIARLLEEHWHSTKVVTRGRMHYADELPGFIAVQEDKPVGLVTYRIDGGECEIVTMDSWVGGVGIGSALIDAVKDIAVSAKCKRLWLITTNDNTAALRFYQKRGFSLVAVHRNALEQSRRLKPEIPLVGIDDIPLRDEIELELLL
jgi:ribosomal protein S18 acetylase RimI-like enzyme